VFSRSARVRRSAGDTDVESQCCASICRDFEEDIWPFGVAVEIVVDVRKSDNIDREVVEAPDGMLPWLRRQMIGELYWGGSEVGAK
jgi:hypothetical protein